MKTKTNKLLTLLAVLAILAIPLVSLLSQTAPGSLVNQSGGIIKNAGIIRFIQDKGTLENNATASTDVSIKNGSFDTYSPSSGTIEFAAAMVVAYDCFSGTAQVGVTAADRLQGFVRYSGSTAETQYIQGMYMASLDLVGTDVKNFGSGQQVFVDSFYTVAGGNRDYTDSRFTYDGPAGGNNDQIIVPEDGNVGDVNIYNELYFMDGGTKTLEAGTIAHAEAEINIDALAIVEVQGTMEAVSSAIVTTAVSNSSTEGLLLLDGTTNANTQDGFFISNDGFGDLDGNIYVYNGGTYVVSGTGVQVFSGLVNVGADQVPTPSSGSISIEDGYRAVFDGDGTATMGVLDLRNVNGAIVVGNGSEAEFAGALNSFVNQVAYTDASNRSNMQFHVNSNALYSNLARIVGTTDAYPYGDLTVSATYSATDLAPEGADGTNGIDVYLAGNFSLDGRLLRMDNDNNPVNGSQVLVMKDDAKTVTYPDDTDGETEEVVGSFKHVLTGTYTPGTALTFNNRATTVALNDNVANLSDFTLSIYPGAIGQPSATDFDIQTDVKRRTRADWTATDALWSADIQLGFLVDEQPTGAFGLSTADLLASLKFRKNIPAAASNKLATGYDVQREVAYLGTNDNFAYASLAGITANPSASLTASIIDKDVTYGQEIFLRGGPTWFITIRPGRWSNPDTWDEGVQPGPNDLCLVRHTVWAGFVQDKDDFETNEDEHLGSFSTNENNLASYIQVFGGDIAEASGNVNYKGALIFGSQGGAAPNDDANKAMASPQWGLRNTLDLSSFKSPFPGATVDAAVNSGNLYITALSGAESNIPTDINTANNAGYTYTDKNGGVINFLNSELTIPEFFTNHGLIVNGGVIILGE